MKLPSDSPTGRLSNSSPAIQDTPFTTYSRCTPLILRLMRASGKTFGEVQDALKEIDEANVRSDGIKRFKTLDTKEVQ